MFKKLNIGDIHASIKNKLENKIGLKVFDVVPEDEPIPFIFLQCIGKEDASSKTMYIEDFKFYIHVLCDGNSTDNVYKMIQYVEEALSEDIDLEQDNFLVTQTEDGVLQILTENTGEKHAVMQYSFKVCYGFKCK